jgi:hypothetical protein
MMKVEKKGEKFQPIVITLETEEEVEALWHMTNAAFSQSLKEYMEVHPLPISVKHIRIELFDHLDMIYGRPRNYK